jgi:hypothetical protein
LDVAYVCYGVEVFSGVLQVFQTYVANVSSRYCKSRYDAAHVAMGSTCHIRLLQLLGRRRASADGPRVHARGKRRGHERFLRVGCEACAERVVWAGMHGPRMSVRIKVQHRKRSMGIQAVVGATR